MTRTGQAAYIAPLPSPPLPRVCGTVEKSIASNLTESAQQYRCPGQPYPISRAVHLGRLVQFYPGCRACQFREQTGPLSLRQVKRLVETRGRGQSRSPLFGEGAAGSYLNDLGPTEARRLAQALGVLLARKADGPTSPPEVVVAGDGRPQAAELVAAASEGLRWSGCGVIDIGRATSPCAASAISRLGAEGGLLVGNPPGRPGTVGMKFWAGGPRPLSAAGTLDQVRRLFETPPDRPTRRFGPLRREPAREPYLAGLADHYHALRPLRFLLGTTCRPVGGYLEELTGPVACEAIPCPALPEKLARDVLQQRLHFGILMGDDGETAAVVDQNGRPVAAERLLVLVARHLLQQRPGAAIVLEDETPPQLAERITALGGRPKACHRGRASMERAMRREDALLGGGTSDRIWHRSAEELAVADGLRTLTLLLEILSLSDRPLSEVLDSDAPAA